MAFCMYIDVSKSVLSINKVVSMYIIIKNFCNVFSLKKNRKDIQIIFNIFSLTCCLLNSVLEIQPFFTGSQLLLPASGSHFKKYLLPAPALALYKKAWLPAHGTHFKGFLLAPAPSKLN